jgi:hypothetical protein
MLRLPAAPAERGESFYNPMLKPGEAPAGAGRDIASQLGQLHTTAVHPWPLPAPTHCLPSCLACPAVVDDLMARGIAEESDGAKCVFIEVSPGLT